MNIWDYNKQSTNGKRYIFLKVLFLALLLVVDIINSFFLLDDGGAFCELHYSTRRGNRNGTRVIISSDIGLVSCQKINGN